MRRLLSIGLLGSLAGLVSLFFLTATFFIPLSHEGILWIEKGTSSSQIAAQMRTLNLPAYRANLWLFKKINFQTLKTGEYQLEKGWTLWQACLHVSSGRVIMHKMTIPEGLSIHQVVVKIQSEPLLTGEIVPPPEASILPETYYFARGTKRAGLLAQMQQAMTEFLHKEWQNRDPSITLSQNECIILASIVEAETPKDREKPIIAGVFYNRLNQGMKLQSDPTVVYALTQGKKMLDKPLTFNDLKVASLFNTYVVEKLPPHPIACPGKAALLATLHPQKHPYIYFVADGTGGHAFSETFDQHISNVQNWRRLRA